MSEDERWIRAVDEAYRPRPASAPERVAFHARLEARLERRQAWRVGALVPVSAVAAALALWLALPVATPGSLSSETALYAFVDPSDASDEASDGGAYLPDDYQALALLLEIDATDP